MVKISKKPLGNPDRPSFLDRYHDCCVVGKSFTANESFIWFNGLALLGFHSDKVHIEYIAPDAREIRNTGRYYGTKGVIAITNCGIAWDVHRGFHKISDLWPAQ